MAALLKNHCTDQKLMYNKKISEYFKKENDMKKYTPEEAYDMILEGTAPHNMIVDGNLYLGNNKKLKKLPDDLRVEGWLNLKNCTALIELPDELWVNNWLNLENCTSLTHLPDGLSFNGSLNLMNCISLTELPDGLRVEEWLDMNGCISLTHLPKGLKVGGWLDVQDCPKLKALPADLQVGDYIYLNDPLSIPDTVECKGFTFRDIFNFPPEFINKPESITPEIIAAQTNEKIKAMLIQMMKV
jgi:hypothetical protein